MGVFSVIRPRDDAEARQSSDWCDALILELMRHGHRKGSDVDDRTPADVQHVLSALSRPADLVCYFGHGDGVSWRTSQTATLDTSSAHHTQGKAVVSIACRTACGLGPAAVTGGASSWLGFTIDVVVMAPHKTVDPFGDALVGALAGLGRGGTMQQARDEIAANLDGLADDFATGWLSSHPAASLGYFGSIAMRDHVVVHGQQQHVPLP